MSVIKALDWSLPKKCSILQFGGSASGFLISLADEYRVSVMPSIGERINIAMAIKSLLTLRFNRWAYYRLFTKHSGAELIVVWNDTSIEAYSLQHHVGIPVWCVQNGHRIDEAPPDSLGFIEAIRAQSLGGQPEVSKYFVFSEAAKQMLEKYVKADFLPLGSYLLNEYATKRVAAQSTSRNSPVPHFGLIVSFPNKRDVPGGFVANNHSPFTRVKGKTISYGDFYGFDALVADALFDFCEMQKFNLSIIGKRSESDSVERDFFAGIPKLQKLNVIGHEKGSGYGVADNFDYLLAIDSTLGYEMLGLGKRVAFIHNRYGSLGINSEDLSFGYPLGFPNDGEFWSSATKPEYIVVFLRRFLQLSDQQWSQLHANITPLLMTVDAGNTTLRSMVRSQLKATN